MRDFPHMAAGSKEGRNATSSDGDLAGGELLVVLIERVGLEQRHALGLRRLLLDGSSGGALLGGGEVTFLVLDGSGHAGAAAHQRGADGAEDKAGEGGSVADAVDAVVTDLAVNEGLRHGDALANELDGWGNLSTVDRGADFDTFGVDGAALDGAGGSAADVGEDHELRKQEDDDERVRHATTARHAGRGGTGEPGDEGKQGEVFDGARAVVMTLRVLGATGVALVDTVAVDQGETEHSVGNDESAAHKKDVRPRARGRHCECLVLVLDGQTVQNGGLEDHAVKREFSQ